ncbi:MAG: peptidylprolyl isomerase [Acidiferrobacterales bacterium]
MEIRKHAVVTIDFELKDDDGNVLDSSEGGAPLHYLHGAKNIIEGLEKALEGKKTGDAVSVALSPEEGYGVHDDDRIQPVPKDMFEDQGQVKVGEQFTAQGPEGEQLTVTIAEVTDDKVVVDGNHPLAGMNLNFEVEIKQVREATKEELDHGHVHGAGGHQH